MRKILAVGNPIWKQCHHALVVVELFWQRSWPKTSSHVILISARSFEEFSPMERSSNPSQQQVSWSANPEGIACLSTTKQHTASHSKMSASAICHKNGFQPELIGQAYTYPAALLLEFGDVVDVSLLSIILIKSQVKHDFPASLATAGVGTRARLHRGRREVCELAASSRRSW